MIKLFVIAAFILPAIGFSQGKMRKDVTPVDLDSIEYTLTSKKLDPSVIKLPFRKIRILDARFDTTKLGFDIQKKMEILNIQILRK